MPAAGGPAKALTSGDHAISGWQIARTGEHVMVLDSARNPGEIAVATPPAPAPQRGARSSAKAPAPLAASAWVLTQISKLHDGMEKRFAIPRTEKITWKGADGILLEGLLTYPVGFTAGQRVYRGLKSNGVPTKLYMAPREPHGWNELRHQLFKMNVELEWFDKYVVKKGYVWEKAPESGS